MRELNDEEIQAVASGIRKPRVPDDLGEALKLTGELIWETYNAIANAQFQADIKGFIELLRDEWVEVHLAHKFQQVEHEKSYLHYKKEAQAFMQSLKQLVEVE